MTPQKQAQQVLEFKGRMLSVTRARLKVSDIEAAARQIEEMSAQMPQAVRGMAVVLDSDVEAPLAPLVDALNAAGMQVLAVGEGPLAAAARKAGMPVVSADNGKTSAREPEPKASQPKAVAPSAAGAEKRASARLVTEPVRSGQQIYAEGTDLIVLSSVSVGAEVIADGSIHVYGKLAGRAIAGARGDETARVFCRKMEAELIAIAGLYAVSEQINDGPRGVAAQAYLDQGRLVIEPHPA